MPWGTIGQINRLSGKVKYKNRQYDVVVIFSYILRSVRLRSEAYSSG